MIILVFAFGATELTGFSENISLNDSALSAGEIEQGGFFTVGVSVARFVGWVGFGIGLPEDTPTWFSTIFFAWQTMITIFTAGFIISSIWDG